MLTPAVYAAPRKAKAKVEPLPLLFAYALIANAASFVLPISNPANLALYGGKMPPPGQWFGAFALPSVAAIITTYAALHWLERKSLAGSCESDVERTPLSTGGKAALAGIVATAGVLIGMSAFNLSLGLPTCLAGLATMLGVCALKKHSPLALAGQVSWSLLAQVAAVLHAAAANPVQGARCGGRSSPSRRT